MITTRSAAVASRRTASDRPETLVALLRERALAEPDALVYEFLIDGEDDVRPLTSGELDARARHVGALLQAHGAQGSRVVLLLPSGPEFVAAYFGCLYSGAVAVPVPPPEEAAATRLDAIVRDSGARFVLTSETHREAAAARFSGRDVAVLAPFTAVDGCSAEWAPPLLDGASLAHLQYTSGPAGSPRGVMLCHDNLLHNSELIRRAADITPEDRLMSWVAPHHEMGLLMGILQPLVAGCTGVLMDPVLFLEAPHRWLRAISRRGVTVSGAPNHAYDLCVRRTTPEQRADLDLSCWRVAMTGTETVEPGTLADFSRTFAPHGFEPIGFYPFYASAEATLLVAGGARPTAPVIGAFDPDALDAGRARLVTARTGRLLASCGQPLPGQLLRIVDPDTGYAKSAGEIGEIWVGGPSVSSGYWRRRAESMDVFGAFIRNTGEGPFMRTGGLGFLLGGQLFVTGRLQARSGVGGQSLLPEGAEVVAGKATPEARS